MSEGFRFKAETPDEKKKRQAADPRMEKPESRFGKVIVPGQDVNPKEPEDIGRALRREDALQRFMGEVLENWQRECGDVMDSQLRAFDRRLKAIEEKLGIPTPAAEETDSPSPD